MNAKYITRQALCVKIDNEENYKSKNKIRLRSEKFISDYISFQSFIAQSTRTVALRRTFMKQSRETFMKQSRE